MSASTDRTSQRRAEHRESTTKKPTTATSERAVAGSVAIGAQTDKPKSPGKPNSRAMPSDSILESGTRDKLVREAAYFRAERRGFSPGGELEDWVAAERDVDQMVAAGKEPGPAFVG